MWRGESKWLWAGSVWGRRALPAGLEARGGGNHEIRKSEVQGGRGARNRHAEGWQVISVNN